MTAACTSEVLHGLPKRIGLGVSRPTMNVLSGNRCPFAKPFRKNILCGIDVSVMECTALRASPASDAKVFDIFVAVSAAAASLAGGEEPVNDDEFLAVPAGLVGKLPADFPPCSVRNMERELMVLHHVLCGQVFHTDDVILLNEFRCHLMDGIISLVGNVLMQPRNRNAGLLAVTTPLCFSGELPLEAGQLLEIALAAMEVVIFYTVRSDNQILNAKVDADNSAGLWQWCDIHIGTAEGDIALAAWFL